MIILGLDPGIATTGFAVVNKKRDSIEIVTFGVISTKPSSSEVDRIFQIATDLSELITQHKPTVVGIEKLFFTTNQKTAISVSQVRGVLLYICRVNNLEVTELTPLQVKNQVSGYGKADKAQVQKVMQMTFNLPSLPKPDDAADALAIAWCTAQRVMQK